MDATFGDQGPVTFGPFLLDPMRRKLLRGGAPIALPAKQFELLLYLAGNAGRAIEKDELLAAVWGVRCVEEGNLSQAVSRLRRALRDGTTENYIVTAPGIGYRFAAEVRRAHDRADIAPMAETPAHAPGRMAKLSPPRLPATIARKRLFALLDEYTQRKIVWVTGPPGAGKTTLVCSYLKTKRFACIWYGVDADDGDPASFFYHLGEAAQQFDRGTARLPLLTPEYLADIAKFTRVFFRALVERLPQQAIIVLDNYQDAAASSPLARIVRDGAAELGMDACLIVISRHEPPASFARMRANQELALLDWDALQLTPDETADIVADHDTHPAAADLHERSGGWPAGLTLLLENRASCATVQGAAFIEAPQTIFDYFATELYEQAPAETRIVWLSTAYLARFTGAAAASLSGVRHADEILDALAKRRTFTDRQTAKEGNFIYHALFREFLRGQVGRLYSLAEQQCLALRSACLAEEAGDFDTALTLFVFAEDWRRASRLLLAQAEALFAHGRFRTLLAWLRRLPPACADETAWLGYWAGVCQGQLDPAMSRAIVQRAHSRFVSDGDIIGQMVSTCAVIESYLVERADFTGVEHWIGKLEALAQQPIDFPSAAMELRFWSVLLQVLSDFQPQNGLGPACVTRVWQLCREATISAGERLMAAAALVFILGWNASQAVAQAAIGEFEALAILPETTSLQRATWCYSKEITSGARGDYESWGLGWRTASEIAAQGGLDCVAAACRPFQLWQFLNEGRLDEAAVGLQAMAGYIDLARPREAAHYHALCAWLLLLQDKPEDALIYAKKVVSTSHDYSAAASRAVAGHDLHAHALAGCGRLEEALAVARKASALCQAPQDGYIRMSAFLHEAEILRRRGNARECLPVLAEGLATGRRGGHFSTVPWLPDMMRNLTTLALAENIEPDYVGELIRRRNLAVCVKI